MDESDAFRFKALPDDSVEAINIEDGRYTALRGDLEADAQDFEADSWSLAVDQHYLKEHNKEAIKRQEVIYELVQTEVNHVRTLKLMLGVYVRELRESLQLDEARLERLFPQVDALLQLHQHFLLCLKQRRDESLQPGSQRNYCLQRLGDILISQFSEETRDRLRDGYGVFCSRQNDAVSLYKEQLQSNKKFQNLIRKISQLSIVRRLGVPECILLVTQRITKYPVLVERIIQNTEADTEEHGDLVRALDLIKGTIAQVDGQVDEREKAARLRDLSVRLEPKALGKLKDGSTLRREELLQAGRTLRHEGTVAWRSASGRLKEVLLVLLSDVVLLLQEKDQRYTFSTVDSKPSVISLQKLIVREVAHDDKAMFLISSDPPVMYEIHTASRDERNAWREHIWQAIESHHLPGSPEMEVEGEWQLIDHDDALPARLRDLQERLYLKDALIVQHLTEKLQLFGSMTEMLVGTEDAPAPSRLLLLRGTASELQQGEQLLKEAIADVEGLQNLLLPAVRDSPPHAAQNQVPGPLLPRRAETFGGYDSNACAITKNGGVWMVGGSGEETQQPDSGPPLTEPGAGESQELSADEEVPPSWNPNWSGSFPKAEFFDKVLTLSQTLYSLQAIVSQQDSCIELQRAALAVRSGNRHRGNNMLLEQEKQRKQELQRAEMASFHRLQATHRQEQARWERERAREQAQAEEADCRLRERGEECQRLEAELAARREELAGQRAEYQQDLERLRDSTRAVEKERERLEQQQRKFKKHKTISNPGNAAQALPLSAVIGDDWASLGSAAGDLFSGTKRRSRPSLLQAAASFLEAPPAVPLRRESISPSSVKADVPIHLVSTTNQVQRPVPVQQQIPTKLAALGKGKEKSAKGKGSHHRTNSAASIDISQVLPMKATGKEGGSLRAKSSIRSVSPQLRPDTFVRPEKTCNSKPSHSASMLKKSSPGPAQTLLPHYNIKENSAKEDIIFF